MLTRLAATPPAIRARAALRRSPRLKWLVQRTIFRAGPRYNEDAFHHAMQQGVRPGDVVWDIGANVGIYTSQFAKWTGPEGSVIAFEPSPDCLTKLQAITEQFTNVYVARTALSNVDGSAMFDTSRGGTSVQNQLSGGGDVEVRVARADSLVAAGELKTPDVVKIDVEGYEPEVLEGFEGIIAVAPRTLFLEVHFGALAKRGKARFPRDVYKRLQKSGYSCEWVDPSHLAAVRR